MNNPSAKLPDHSPRVHARSAGVAESIPAIDEHGARVQSMFSSIAHGYDRANRWMSLGTDQSWRRRAVAHLFLDSVPSDRKSSLLDLCAGTLDSSREIHRQLPGASIVAGDFSAGMLARGRSQLRGSETTAIDAIEMDAHALPLADASIDAAFCAFGMRNLSRLDVALTELARVLRPSASAIART